MIFPFVLKQPSNTKAVVHFYPRQTNTPVTSRSHSTPNTNPFSNSKIALLSNGDTIPPRVIQTLSSHSPLDHFS